eukprot:gene5692-663_t
MGAEGGGRAGAAAQPPYCFLCRGLAIADGGMAGVQEQFSGLHTQRSLIADVYRKWRQGGASRRLGGGGTRWGAFG